MIKRMLFQKLLVGLAVVWMLSAMALAFDFSSVEKKVTDFTLDNGMKFIIVEDHTAPVISFVIQADVGGADDPKQASGLAHMFEHMAFKGTSEIGTKNFKAEKKALEKLDAIYHELHAERRKGANADEAKLAELEEQFKAAQEEAESHVEINEFTTIVDREGGVGLNAGTGYDNTTYYFSFPSNKLELWFYLESSRFTDPVLRQFYKERDVVMEERRMSRESSPIGRLQDEFIATMFKAHPYGNSLIGQSSEISNYDKEIALEFFRTYYVASNMVAAMVGDIDPAEAKKLADKYFGRLPKVPKPERLFIKEPKQKAERIIAMPDQSQPILIMGFQRPPYTHEDDAIYDAISDYLGQGRTSMLYKHLVKDKKLASTIGSFSSFPAGKYDCGFGVFAVPNKGYTALECDDEIMDQIDWLKNNLVPEEEVEKIKARAKANFVNSLSSRSGLASQLASYQNYFGDWRELFKSLDNINAVTGEEIKRVANELFRKDNRTVAYIVTEES